MMRVLSKSLNISCEMLAITLKTSTFASVEVIREWGGGISLSAKSRHLPLRKQSRHDSMGKSTGSLVEAALFVFGSSCRHWIFGLLSNVLNLVRGSDIP